MTKVVGTLLAVFIVGVLAVFFVVSCEGESTKPTYHYRASFEPAMIDGVEEFMHGVAKRWELSLFEKDRKEMKVISLGKEAFYNALCLKDHKDWILSITNAGAGSILILYLYKHEDMAFSELQRLDNEVRTGLKERFGIELVPYVEPHLRDETLERNPREGADKTHK